MEYNTPSGELKTALDKFVYRYTKSGYTYKFEDDGSITFTKGKEKNIAIALHDSKGWITGYRMA